MIDFEKVIDDAWTEYAEVHDGTNESGGLFMQGRLSALAAISALNAKGDLIEIGAWRGWTSQLLGAVAVRFRRKLIVVDPWPEEDVYEEFLNSIHFSKPIVEIYRTTSQDPEFIKMIKERELCFAFVDGLHSYEAVKVDLATVGHCNGIIVVDDVSWNGGIRKAVDEVTGKKLILNEVFRECYLI